MNNVYITIIVIDWSLAIEQLYEYINTVYYNIFVAIVVEWAVSPGVLVLYYTLSARARREIKIKTPNVYRV